jgi:hypothetical protein
MEMLNISTNHISATTNINITLPLPTPRPTEFFSIAARIQFIHFALVRSEVLTVAKMLMAFWVATPCGLVGAYQSFGETYCLHPERWYISTYKPPRHYNPENQHRHFILSLPFLKIPSTTLTVDRHPVRSLIKLNATLNSWLPAGTAMKKVS